MDDLEARLRSADEGGDATAATQLGHLLAEEGDASGALAAFRRADERGDGLGAYHLGLVLQQGGADLSDVAAALARAERRGCDLATPTLDSMIQPLPGEHPISLESRRAALRNIGSS
jgi:TPR repeat protein